MLACAGVMLAMRTGEPATIPWTPLAPASPIRPATPTAGDVHDPAVADDAAPERRSATLPDAADVRPTSTAVHVLQAMGDARRALSQVEVMLRTGEHELHARTDADGVARFELRGGHGQTATAWCGLGPGAQFRLDADTPATIELVVRPRVRVQGSVRTAAGQPVADAAIVMLPWPRPGDDHPQPLRVARSRADGSFDVALAAGGRLGANHRVHGPSAMFLVMATPDRDEPLPVTTVSLVLLDQPPQVTGTVHDHAGTPVAGARIEFRSLEAPPSGSELRAVPQRVQCDEAGRFVATHLAAGRVGYAACARGHGPSSGILTLTPAAAASLQIRLSAPCTVTGSVFAAGAPVAGATVTAGERGTFGSRSVATAEDGAFTLVDLPAGSVPLLATDRDGRRATTTLELQPGHAHEWRAELRDLRRTNVHGSVVAADGRPLAGWTVVARPHGGAPGSGTSDDHGAFAIACGPGLVDLRAHAPQHGTRDFATAVLRAADPAAGPIRFVVPADAHGAVTAIVQTVQQQPIAATIACWHHERAEHVRFTARADGTFALPRVPAGTIDLLFEHPGHASTARRELAITAGQTVELGVVALGIGGALFGNVRGPDGSGPSDCVLTVLAGGQRFEATYGGGAYRFPTLPAGDHVLLVQGAGLAAMSFPIAIAAGVDLLQDIELRAGVPRAVRVHAPPGAPATVALAIRVAGKPMQWLATGVGQPSTDGSRVAEFTACMAPGTYEALAWAAGGFEARATIGFGASDDTAIVMQLAK